MQRKVIEHAQNDLSKVGSEVAAQPAKQTLWDKVADHFIDRMAPEIGDMLMQKTAQGSAELSQFLNQGNAAYTPYGYAQKPLEVEGPQQSWQQQLQDASQRAGQQQNEMER
jgi:hypothetical protein